MSDAAQQAFSGRSKSETAEDPTGVSKGAGESLAPREPRERSTEERLIDDIETGLDLLNTVFGN